MNIKGIFSGLILLLLSISTFAASIFSITTTNNPVTVAPNATVTITYTVQNTSGVSMPGMKYFPPAGTTISSTTCGSTLANGASCTIQLTFQAPSTQGTITLGPMKVCGRNGQICSQSNAANQVKIIIASAAIMPVLTVAGMDFTGTQPPVLAVSTDGNNWAVKSVTDNPATGQWLAASCTGSGTTAICTVAGQNLTGSPQPPLLAVSTDGGNTWAVKTVTNNPVEGTWSAASCTGSGAAAICTVAGFYFDITGAIPVLAISTDGGNTWAVEAVTGSPANGTWNGTSCTGSGATAICTVAGQDLTGFQQPCVLAVSTDGGSSWAVKTVVDNPANGSWNAASCTGSGATAICMVAGQDLNAASPALAVSTDGGNTWAVKTVTNNPTTGVWNAANCTGSGATAVCMAVGQDFDASRPVLAVSTDGGNTWAVKTVTNNPALGFWVAASCTGNGAAAICVAAGQNGIGTVPSLAVSTDGGNTWAVKTVTNNPTSGIWNGANCVGSGATAICTVAGQDSNAAPLAVSTDGGNTWAVKTVTDNPASGAWSAAGGTPRGVKPKAR